MCPAWGCLTFKIICGQFVWIFWFFMAKHAQMSESLHSRARTLRLPCVLLAIRNSSLRLCSEDVELIPCPNQGSEETSARTSSVKLDSDNVNVTWDVWIATRTVNGWLQLREFIALITYSTNESLYLRHAEIVSSIWPERLQQLWTLWHHQAPGGN